MAKAKSRVAKAPAARLSGQKDGDGQPSNEGDAVYRGTALPGGELSIPGGSPEPPVDIKLTRFLPSLAEVPTKELESIKERAIKSGFDFIDFWAIDFDWKPDQPFNHHWQDYRTRKDRSLVTVVDVFGCDTSITVRVKV